MSRFETQTSELFSDLGFKWQWRGQRLMTWNPNFTLDADDGSRVFVNVKRNVELFAGEGAENPERDKMEAASVRRGLDHILFMWAMPDLTEESDMAPELGYAATYETMLTPDRAERQEWIWWHAHVWWYVELQRWGIVVPDCQTDLLIDQWAIQEACGSVPIPPQIEPASPIVAPARGDEDRDAEYTRRRQDVERRRRRPDDRPS